MTSAGAAMRARISELLASQVDRSAVGLRELPFTLVFAAILLVESLTGHATHPYVVLGAAIAAAAVQVVAFVGRWDAWPDGWQYALPLTQMVAAATLAYGADRDASAYAVLLFLPVVNLALHPGFLGVALGTLGAGAVILVPTLLHRPSTFGASSEANALLVTVCAFFVGAGTAIATGRLRDQATALEALRRSQEATLHRLAQSRAVLASILDAATEQLVVGTDLDGRIEIAGPGARHLLRADEAELADARLTDYFAPDELRAAAAQQGLSSAPSDLARALVGAAAQGDPDRREWTVIRSDGTVIPVELTVTPRPSFDPQGAEGYLFVGTDLTQRREAERLQEEFIGLVSHELRTPLASIMGYVGLLLADDVSEDQRHSLEVVERNGQRLLRLVEDLLLSAQLAAGSFGLHAEDVDAVEIVRRSVASLAPTAAAAGIGVSLEAPAELPFRSDAQRLGQVVENLVANAVKFTPRGGSVLVGVHPSQAAEGDHASGVRLVVTDDGPGMSAEEVSQVTARFYRSRSVREQHIRGLGLGLSIVEAIATAHGGTMTIDSAPGEGTSVVVTLPELPTPPRARSSPPGSSGSTE